MANVYDFRPGRSIKGLSPQVLGEELERIRSARGSLTRAIVLEEATPPDSPLHVAFPWDDAQAAHEHRLQLAGRLVTSVRVLNSPVAQAPPAFVSVRTPDKGRSYVPTVEAMSDEELRVRVLAEARQFIESLERRYAHFQGIADVLGRLKQQVA